MHSNLDKQWVLSCDASSYGVACVLQQRIDGNPDQDESGNYTDPKNKELRPVAYFSKKLTDSERKSYCIYEKEAYAVVWGLEICKSYIMGSRHPVLVFTDNKALTWLKDSDQPGRLGRWQAQINMYHTDVRHQPATKNMHADGFSRNPIDDVTGVKIPAIRTVLQSAIPRCGAAKNVQTNRIVDVDYSTELPTYIVETDNGLFKYPACDVLNKAKELYWDKRLKNEPDTALVGVNDAHHYALRIQSRKKETRVRAFTYRTQRQKKDSTLDSLIKVGELTIRAASTGH